MKIKELEKIIDNLDLKCIWGNQNNVIMQVWQPHSNSGFKVGSKYYSSEVLPYDEVKKLNSKFEKLLKTLKKHKIKISDVDIVENGIISQINLVVRFDALKPDEKNLDFEIDDFEDWKGGNWFDYNDVMPDDIGYGSSFYDSNVSNLFKDFKLKKHEREMVIANMKELFDRFMERDSYDWVMNFAINQNDITPLQYWVENYNISPKYLIEAIFENDEIYYDNEKEYKKIFGYLTTLKADDLDINQNSHYRGMLPDVIITSRKMFKQTLDNWEFEYDSGQRVLTFIIQDEHFKEFKLFIENKDPKKYYFDDWYDLQEYTLKTIGLDDLKLVQKLFDDKWMEMEHIDDEYVIDYIIDQLRNTSNVTNEPILIKEFIKVKDVKSINKLLGLVLEISRDNKFNIPTVVQPFIDNPDKLDFTQADAEIMKYLDDSHPLSQRLLSDDKFIQYLVDIDKLEYLPKSVTDVFLF